MLLLLTALTLCGCGSGIFYEQEEVKISERDPVKAQEMIKGVLYVKDGTTFYPVRNTETFYGSARQIPDPKTEYLLLSPEEVSSFATLYRGEPLCIKTSDNLPKTVYQIERYTDCGWTIGVGGLKYNEKMGYFDTRVSNLKEGSSFAEVLSGRIGTQSIGIGAVDGMEPFTVSQAGTISGMKEGNAYEILTYAGSESETFTALCDTKIFESSETFTVSSAGVTPYGYIEFFFPEDVKSGYYKVSNVGVIRYFDRPRYETDPETVYMNEPNQSEGYLRAVDDSLASSEQGTIYTLAEDRMSLEVSITYAPSFADIEEAEYEDPDGAVSPIPLNGGHTTYKIEPAKKGTYLFHLRGKHAEDAEVTVKEGRPLPTPTPLPTEAPKPDASSSKESEEPKEESDAE